jgi:hypothetical protein
MPDPQRHRVSLLLALIGVTLMLAVAITNLLPGPMLPNRDASSSDHPGEFWMPVA